MPDSQRQPLVRPAPSVRRPAPARAAPAHRAERHPAMGNQAATRLLADGAVQARLNVGRPDDPLEQEAERVAQAIAGVPGPQDTGTAPVTGRLQPRIQRACASCQASIPARGAPAIGRRCSQCEDELQRKAGPAAGTRAAAPVPVEARIGALRGAGQQLPAPVRSFFEQRMGQDFGAVRVHTGSIAAETTRALDARAYTVGTDIAFAPGQYAPGSHEGRRLLAHELTHVVQQGAAGDLVQRACGPDAIGAPAGCAPDLGEPVGDLVLYRISCDEYASGAESAKVVDFADSMETGERVRVHGMASTDGDPAFNHHLACARAMRASFDLIANGIAPAQIDTLEHGPTPGPAAQRRSVVLERVPGASREPVPQLSAPLTVGPTPGACGGLNQVNDWTLSRNAHPVNGGFVLQEITETWHVDDCTGAPVANPDPRTSPLHFFEAWRVAPGTTAITSCGTTDTWFWPDALPWAGGCTTGNVSIIGHAVYHDNVAAAAMPAHMAINNPATFSGCLQSSVVDPALGGNASRPVDRQLDFHWNCCPCSSSPTIIDVART